MHYKRLPCRLASVICEHLTILLPDSNHELVYAHGSVNSDFSTKIVANLMRSYCAWSMLGDNFGEAVNSHVDVLLNSNLNKSKAQRVGKFHAFFVFPFPSFLCRVHPSQT
jgi:hypothetical protein